MNEREQYILKALIERYIREGQPVGSKALAEEGAIALSSATIRNVLAELEDAGYIFSPHTSAGRVPTVSGYRFFIDTLLTLKPIDAAQIAHYKLQLRGKMSVSELMQSTSHLLSGVTHQVGLVTLPRLEQMILRHVEFLPLSQQRVLIILVLNEQDVQNRIIETDRVYSASELEQAANYLNAQFAGKDLPFIRKELLDALQSDKEQLNQGMDVVLDMATGLLEEQSDQDDVMVAGHSNLLDLASTRGIDSLKGLFDAFSQKRDILHLLDQCLRVDGVQIFVGEESGHKILEDCSVITAPYFADGQILGVLGVVGPTRMDYERVIPIVDMTAKLLSTALEMRK